MPRETFREMLESELLQIEMVQTAARGAPQETPRETVRRGHIIEWNISQIEMAQTAARNAPRETLRERLQDAMPW